MFLVAVTGGIASGKTTVTRMFAELGCPVIDADLIAREGRNLLAVYVMFSNVGILTPELRLRFSN